MFNKIISEQCTVYRTVYANVDGALVLKTKFDNDIQLGKRLASFGNVLKNSETFTMGILRLSYIYANFFPKTCDRSKCDIFGQ